MAALILGLAGCGVWMLPYNLDTLRPYSPLPFGLLGIALAVIACIGPRRGKPLAVVGWILSFIALTLAAIMIVSRFT